MISDITFGQYFPTNSLIHKMDPRVKFLIMVFAIVFIFIAKSMYSMLSAVLFILICVFVSKVPLKLYLNNLKAILPIIIFTAIINSLYINEGKILLDWWIFTISSGGVARSIFMAIRIALLIFISSILTYTTTPNDLTDGIESLCYPLKFIGLGSLVHIMTMMMTIALRFIPTLIEETGKIMNAQKARGADLESGSLINRVKALIPILIPLLIMSVRRAYDLAEAMECRCYNGGIGKQRLKKLKIKKCDVISCCFFLIWCASIILINIYF